MYDKYFLIKMFKCTYVVILSDLQKLTMMNTMLYWRRKMVKAVTVNLDCLF